MKTIKELAQEALDVQDACNLSGVVYAFSRAISRLRELYPNEHTGFYNSHAICIMYASKIEALTGLQNEDWKVLHDAIRTCEHLTHNTEWPTNEF